MLIKKYTRLKIRLFSVPLSVEYNFIHKIFLRFLNVYNLKKFAVKVAKKNYVD